MAILLIFLGYNLAAIHKRYNVTAKDNALWLLQHFCSLFLKCSLGLGFFFMGLCLSVLRSPVRVTPYLLRHLFSGSGVVSTEGQVSHE